jgi:hypothetical protein
MYPCPRRVALLRVMGPLEVLPRNAALHALFYCTEFLLKLADCSFAAPVALALHQMFFVLFRCSPGTLPESKIFLHQSSSDRQGTEELAELSVIVLLRALFFLQCNGVFVVF